MDFAFTPEQEELVRALRAFARKELAPRSAHWDRTAEFPWDVWTQMGELGLFGLRVPAEYGGREADLLTTGIAAEEIARGDFSCTYGIQLAALAGEILGREGSEELKRRWRPPLVAGEVVMALALTEPGVGSDAANLACRAERDGDDHLLTGEKSGISLGMAAHEETMGYVKERRTFGQPLARYEGVSFPIAEAATHIEAARWLAYRALWLADRGAPYTKESAMAKWWAPKLAVEVIHQCLLLHGHYGYTDELPFEQRLRDVIGFEIGDGTPEVMKIVVARELMGRESLPY
jgi:alkylation response protein AidB-like acyl-CoA dehydrogenase